MYVFELIYQYKLKMHFHFLQLLAYISALQMSIKDVSSGPLFRGLNAKKTSYTILPMGKNTLGDIGKDVARELNLDNPEVNNLIIYIIPGGP